MITFRRRPDTRFAPPDRSEARLRLLRGYGLMDKSQIVNTVRRYAEAVISN
jgi:hypothetical protein